MQQVARSLLLTPRYLFHGIADVIAPERCLLCLQEGSWLCRTCAPELPRPQQSCIVCNQPQPRGRICPRHGKQVALSGVMSAGGYSWDYLRRGVHWLKFRGVRAVAPTLAFLLFPYLELIAPLGQLQHEAVLVPIPLHPRRLRARGFNQSLDIAQALSAHTGIPVQEVLQRAKATVSQAELPHEMRQENMEEAFATRPKLPHKKYFILIDDVVTTGSTLLSAAAALKAAHVDQVWGVTVARG